MITRKVRIVVVSGRWGIEEEVIGSRKVRVSQGLGHIFFLDLRSGFHKVCFVVNHQVAHICFVYFSECVT